MSAREAVPAADSEQQAFISFVAHEMKTPLTIIKGYAATLRRSLEDDYEREMAADIEREADRVTRILNQLLDVFRIESGTLNLSPQPLEVIELVEEVVARHRTIDPSRPIRIDLEDELFCQADEAAVRRALDHLLLNARQHSTANQPVIVSAATSSGCVEIAVRDQGPGIPDDEVPRLTEKLFRGRAAGGDGLGLGLYIVDRLLAGQQGRLEIESTPGAGSTFRLLLPAAADSPAGG